MFKFLKIPGTIYLPDFLVICQNGTYLMEKFKEGKYLVSILTKYLIEFFSSIV